jgi:hypothetical protein
MPNQLHWFCTESAPEPVYNQGAGRELRNTVGSRLFGQRGQWDYDDEAAYQFGSFGTGAIRAWTADTNTGYRVQGWKWKPHFTLRTDAASGEKNPRSRNLGTFNPLFPILRFSPGQEGTIAPANLLDVHPMVDLNLQRSVQVTFDSDFLWRESLYDGIYLPGPSLVVSGLNSRARYIGDKNGVELDWAVTQHVSLSVYYSNLLGGPFVKQSNLAHDVIYVATVRPGRDRLKGWVEVDETYVGGPEEGYRIHRARHVCRTLIPEAATRNFANV